VPIYEYLCEGCAYKFEVKQSIKDDPIATCERCGKPVKRLISSPGIMFKGSGWYVTDYSDKLKPPTSGETAPKTAGEKTETATSTSNASASTPAAPANTSTGTAPASPPPSPKTTSSDK
jgi:putative FmdB family regulatory protein